ncbi:hypothetical protein TNCV_4311141 [Trichonephila clavipes]|nr:hypothetical protein TNCV_4311141 [Trichonephila clavipes]
MKELSNGQLQDDFLQSLWLQRMPPHIMFYLHPQSLWINWLSLIRFLRLLVHPQLSVLPQLFLHHPNHLHAVSANHGLSRQADPRAVQVAELTKERNSSRHQLYSSDRRRSHSRSRVSIESGICYYHRRYKELCAFVISKKRVSSVIAGMAEPLETYQPVIFIRPQVPEIPHRLWK